MSMPTPAETFNNVAGFSASSTNHYLSAGTGGFIIVFSAILILASYHQLSGAKDDSATQRVILTIFMSIAFMIIFLALITMYL